jgi:CelD/BcsL family acetyltransferase involved in cellulose biosynthesis
MGTFADYLASLASATRKDIQRHLKRFKDFGDAKQVRFFEKPEEIAEGLELLLEVHRHSWKGEFVNPHYPEFYRDITPILCQRGEAFIAVALLEGKPISAGYVLTNGDTYFSLINDHDSQHRDLAPGTMLFVYEMDRLIESGHNRFDFCGTTYEYKERLANQRTEHSTFQIFHGGRKSRFLFVAKAKWLPTLRKILGKPQPQDVIEIADEY